MKLKSIYWLSISCVLLALAACKDDPQDGPDDPGIITPPLPELALPKNPVVSVKQAKVVVVEWEGDETATSYEVEMAGRTVELEGTSCGMYVKDNTDYTWKVRAIRGEDITEWVAGPPFRTLVYEDPRNEWVGEWKVGKWDLKVDAAGISVPMDEVIGLLPEDIINAIQDIVRFKLTTPEEDGIEIPGYDELLISFDLLEEFGFPVVAAVFLSDGIFSADRYMKYPLDYPGLPLDVSEIPFLRNIPGLGEIESLQIKKLQIELTELQLLGGPVSGDTMPFSGILGGNIVIETGDAMVNLSLGFLKPKLKLFFTTDVERVQIVPEG